MKKYRFPSAPHGKLLGAEGDDGQFSPQNTLRLIWHKTVIVVERLGQAVVRTDESVIKLANISHHLRSLGLYYCQNITNGAMYSLAQSRIKNKQETSWVKMKPKYEDEGLMNLNISQCTALTPPAVQAVCDSFQSLNTCPGRHSLIISGCLSLTSVHCACSVQARRATSTLAH